MDVGSMLRNAREQRGLTLEQISRATRITRPILDAIEHNAFERVPSGIFTRAFLRAYAAEVGLSAEQVVDTYLRQIAPPPEPESSAVEQQPPRSWEVRLLPDWLLRVQLARRADPVDAPAAVPSIGLHSIDAARRQWNQIEWRALWPPLTAIGVLLVLGSLTYLTWREVASTTGESRVTETRTASDESTPRPPSDVAATSGRDDDAVRATDGGGLRVELHTSGPCWIAAATDSARGVYRLMQAGERETLTATHELTLRVGDPAQLEWTINGRPGRALGRAAMPVTVHITDANHREFWVER